MTRSPGILTLILTSFILSCNSGSTEKEDGKLDNTVPTVVTADIEAGIKAHIDEQVKKGGGYFHMKTADKDLKLELVRVHTEYLANLGPRSHFACVDLADVSGDVYDVDFFLEGVLS